jgi:hypothetical protein
MSAYELQFWREVEHYDLRRMLRPLIKGCLQHCIHEHGPITRDFVDSATKRILNGIAAHGRHVRLSNDQDALHQLR